MMIIIYCYKLAAVASQWACVEADQSTCKVRLPIHSVQLIWPKFNAKRQRHWSRAKWPGDQMTIIPIEWPKKWATL